jgi:hypothetical protein
MGLDVYEEDLQENRDNVIDFLAENTSYDRTDIAAAVDGLVLAGRVVCKLNDVVSQIGGGKRGVTKAVAQGVRSGVKGVKLAAKGGAIRQNAIPGGSKIEYIGPGKVKFDGVEFKAVRDLGHMSETDLRKMRATGSNAFDISGIRLDGHHHQQQYHREPGAFMVEIPHTQHCISNPNQHPLGTSGGLTAEQRADWKKLRKAFTQPLPAEAGRLAYRL